jgi:catechol 2,3-dioxygenase-like lactoylglutathione lyase family enzyme
MAAPLLSHILETSLYVAELERAEGFYRRVFGFEPLYRDHRMVALRVPGQGVLLLFLHGSTEASGGPVPAHGGSGRQHLCFAIPKAALEEWEAHLAGLGVPVESRVTWKLGGVSLYLRDPDGHSVELATPGLWANY